MDKPLKIEKQPENPRQHLALTPLEFSRIGGVFEYWTKQPGYSKRNKGAFKTFLETRDNYTKWTLAYLRQFWPNAECKVLEFRKTFEIEALTACELKEMPVEMYDTVAFKFAKGRPELYLLVSKKPMILDEMRFNAYDNPDGKYKRPNWEMEKEGN